jgi:magnesium chelatase family protein
MSSCIHSAALNGIDAQIIQIETRITPGVQYFIVGLPDESVKESLIRVESAICSADLNMPRQKVVISMAPAGIRKQGALFDLPIAVSILTASSQIKNEEINTYVFIGELTLSGKLRPAKSVLAMTIEAKKEKFKNIIAPQENVTEAALVSGINVYGFTELPQVVNFLNGELDFKPTVSKPKPGDSILFDTDFAEVKGQSLLKRAMEIAAAGNHNLLMIGPPGAGKTMISKRMPTILPKLDTAEAMITTKIYAATDQFDYTGLIDRRPFRTPHHTSSDIAIVGGGMPFKPGEISLAHNGVLFLDELPEFKRTVLEVLRQPLEERKITIARANYNITLPADFLLIAAMNPCPCGYFKHPDRKCSCSMLSIRKYLAKLSGPLLDRFDLHVKVAPVGYQMMNTIETSETSYAIRSRVNAARKIQQKRQSCTNNKISAAQLKSHCGLEPYEQTILQAALEKHRLSARSHERILKVARTIADLGNCKNISLHHLSEAITLRCLDLDYFQ